MAEQNAESGRATTVEEEGPQAGNNDQQDLDSPPRKKGRRRFIVIGVVAVLVVGALLFWWHSTYYEDTDDAQVDGHLIQISARVAGQVIKVNVEENQLVQAGTVLAEIDPKDFEVTVQQDEASLQSAEANYEAVRVKMADCSGKHQLDELLANSEWRMLLLQCNRPRDNWKRRKPRCGKRKRTTSQSSAGS